MKISAGNFLFILFSILSGSVYSTQVLPECDIVFYKGDTLYMEKVFESDILKAIEKQPDFKSISSPVRVNHYKAYWKIEDHKMFLVKVTNCISDFCSQFLASDTLDLKKAFREKYVRGKVEFEISDTSIYLHKRFKLRSTWNWFPTYIEDYTVIFKNHVLSRIDTATNYIDDPEKLNRYSLYQLESGLFPLLLESVQVNPNLKSSEKIKFGMAVEINPDGTFSNLKITNITLSDLPDSIIDFRNFANYILTEETEEILENVIWDEINSPDNDQVGFEFEYVTKKKELSSPRFREFQKIAEQRELERLPWFIKQKYDH